MTVLAEVATAIMRSGSGGQMPEEWHIEPIEYERLRLEMSDLRRDQGLPVWGSPDGGLLVCGVPVYGDKE